MNSPGSLAHIHFWPKSKVFRKVFSAKAVVCCRTAEDCFSRSSAIFLPICQKPTKAILAWFILCAAISRVHFTPKSVTCKVRSLFCRANSEFMSGCSIFCCFFPCRHYLLGHDHVICWAKRSSLINLYRQR